MRDLRNLLEQAAVVPSEPVDIGAIGRRARLRRRRRRATVGGGVAAVLVTVVVAVTLAVANDSEAPLTTSPDAVTRDRTWSQIAPAPLERRDGAAAVWTARELIVWGGTARNMRAMEDGAAYNPETKTWRTIADGPLQPRQSPVAVWTGTEMIVWGGGWDEIHDDGAAYNPEADSWRTIADGPLSARFPAAYTWTGSEMIVWGTAGRGTGSTDGAAYDPETNTWRTIAPAPLTLNLASAAWTGEVVVIVGSRLDGNNWPVDQDGDLIERRAGARSMAYDPESDTWTVLPDPDLSAQATFVVADGERVVAWDYLLQARRFDSGRGAWLPLPDVPLEGTECYPSGSLHEGRVLATFCDNAALLDADDAQWTRLDPPFGTVIAGGVWTGREVLVWGQNVAVDHVHLTGWRYRPPSTP
jgi:hypothetical protein